MNQTLPEELAQLLSSLKGKECWYVSCGGAVGSSFQLALGGKVRRDRPSKNTAHTEEYRQFEGEMGLLVWSVWRLDASDGPVTSWDDANDAFQTGIERLVGSRIESVEVFPPAWDMNVIFSNSLCLRIFCDHVPGDPSFDGNWDLWNRDVIIAVGPGSRRVVERRHSP